MPGDSAEKLPAYIALVTAMKSFYPTQSELIAALRTELMLLENEGDVEAADLTRQAIGVVLGSPWIDSSSDDDAKNVRNKD